MDLGREPTWDHVCNGDMVMSQLHGRGERRGGSGEAQAELTTLRRVAAAEWPETHARLSPEIRTFGNPFGIDRGTEALAAEG
jgi:hypothetical protein